MFDRLPTPWGLVRAGVAPDHPKIKAVTRVYEKTAARRLPLLRQRRGRPRLSRDELTEHYHAVLYAFGAQPTGEGIHGEDLPGCLGDRVRRLVQRPPGLRDREFDLTAERAVVVGNGNVALDVARMLACRARRSRRPTSPTTRSRRSPARSVERDRRARPARPGAGGVHEAGADGAREIGRGRRDRRPGRHRARPASERIVEEADAQTKKKIEVLHGYAATRAARPEQAVVLRFLASPVEIVGDERVEG